MNSDSAKSPVPSNDILIRVDVDTLDPECSISGTIEFKLMTEDNETICEMTKEFGKKKTGDEDGSSGLRHRPEKTSTMERGSSSSNGTATKSIAPSSTTAVVKEEDQKFYYPYFPSFDGAKHAAHDIAKKVFDASLQYMHFYHLPHWMRDNEFLHFFHRPPTPSIVECFKSIFRLHTETGNIWTHMLGCALFIGITAYFISRPQQEVTLEDKLAFAPFLLGAIACLGCSFTFHTMACHSESVGWFFNKLDYVGILFLIVGSFVPWVHYGFYCQPRVKMFYIITVSLLGVLVMVLSLWEKFCIPEYRTFRVVAFAALGMFGVVPFVHFICTHGFHPVLLYLFLMAFLYLFGAFLYAARVPERFFPGKFDIWCQSHQIFHICVVIAAIAHYQGTSGMATELARRHAAGITCENWFDYPLL